MKSIAQERGAVSFPEPQIERHYMIPFKMDTGLPSCLAHWQPTVDQMLDGIHTDGTIYFMVHRAVVKVGGTLRRPGRHVDGHWVGEIHAHRGDHRGTPGNPPGHIGSGWNDRVYPEAILLASDISGCVGYNGEYEYPTPDFNRGDCAAVPVTNLEPIVFHANRVYAGNAMMLHDPLPMPEECLRTLVRLNVVGWEP